MNKKIRLYEFWNADSDKFSPKDSRTKNILTGAYYNAIPIAIGGSVGTIIGSLISRFGTSEYTRQKLIRAYKNEIFDLKQELSRTRDVDLIKKLEKKINKYSAVLNVLEQGTLREVRKLLAKQGLKRGLMLTAGLTGGFGILGGLEGNRAHNEFKSDNSKIGELYNKLTSKEKKENKHRITNMVKSLFSRSKNKSKNKPKNKKPTRQHGYGIGSVFDFL